MRLFIRQITLSIKHYNIIRYQIKLTIL